MPSFGLGDSASAIRKRIGPNARYTSYTPPELIAPLRARRRPWDRFLWSASLVLLFIVLVLAVLVALGL
jgi:hypothetical protein